MDLFFYADLKTQKADDIVKINDDEAKHLSVRRYQVNDEITLFDGNGLTARAKIEQLKKSTALLTINQIDEHKASQHRIIIASALPKNDRIHTMLDSCTQLGMTDFIPLSCQRSITRLINNDHKYDKFEKYVIESCKQCQRVFLPKLHNQNKLVDIFLTIDNMKENVLAFYADAKGAPLSDSLDEGSKHSNASKNVLMIIGPEGGFDQNELDLLEEKLTAVSLNDAILRTETAAMTATGIIKHYFN